MKSPILTPPPSRRPSDGFTLVELLVVILIIVVLAAISFTVTVRAKASANMARDTGKMREIAAAIASYAGDLNNRLPVDPKYDPAFSLPEDLKANTTSFCRFELIDRYLPRDDGFPTGSWYAFQKRSHSPWLSDSAKPYPGWQSQSAYPNLKGPIAFAFNPNIEHQTNWMGYLSKVPDTSRYVIMAEQNDRAANNLDPKIKAETANNVKTRYRTSHPGGTGLYLFADFHVEALKGDRSYNYYAAHPGETNIWKWWK